MGRVGKNVKHLGKKSSMGFKIHPNKWDLLVCLPFFGDLNGDHVWPKLGKSE